MEVFEAEEWESPRAIEQRKKLTEYAIFEAMMDEADAGKFTREDAFKSLRNDKL